MEQSNITHYDERSFKTYSRGIGRSKETFVPAYHNHMMYDTFRSCCYNGGASKKKKLCKKKKLRGKK